jgi:predicted nucleic acid-binding protein
VLQIFAVYIIDTNIIIDIARRIYPQRLRDEARSIVERLIQDASVISHREVYLELQDGAKQGDAAFAWAKNNSAIFHEVTAQQEADVLSVLADHPDLVDPKKTGPDADPWLIALALETGGVVVTGDGSTGRSGRTQIKDVCDALGIRCIDVDVFLSENGWLASGSSSATE